MMRFEELGRRVASLQDDDRKALGAAERASESFVRAIRRKPNHARRALWLAAGVLSVVAATSAWHLRPAPAVVEVAMSSSVGVGKSIEAPGDRAIPIAFSDGSQLLLAPRSRAAVKQLTTHGADFDLESGKASVTVTHRANTQWSLTAGPYRVAVTGTRFDLSWSPTIERFEIDLVEGSVVVTTSHSSHAAVTMSAPERLVIERDAWSLSPVASSIPEANAVAPTEADPSSSGVRQVSAPTPTIASTKPESVPTRDLAAVPPEWQQLGKMGKFNDAYSKANEHGIQRLASSESAQSLLSLAEVCRFAGHASEAMLVLTKLRQRFPGTREAAIAAFQLGRLSSDAQFAASWFRSYLNERPSGELAREASGRLLEALDRAGDRSAAQQAARSYLERYPEGPHAKFAKRLVSP